MQEELRAESQTCRRVGCVPLCLDLDAKDPVRVRWMGLVRVGKWLVGMGNTFTLAVYPGRVVGW